ncbi:MAG: hypothetical protein RLZ98_3128 [Pseudomonadota bacterium]|jgi:hypothetical protein
MEAVASLVDAIALALPICDCLRNTVAMKLAAIARSHFLRHDDPLHSNILLQQRTQVLGVSATFKLPTGRKRRPFIGWGWHLAAVAVAVGILLTWPKEIPAFGPMALGLIVGPLLLYRQGHRHFVPTAAEMEAHDKRAPFLYLRSFQVDQKLDADEEALARLLATEGPFLAIGDPHKPLPSLAAARDFLPEDDWKDVVLDRMVRARLILLVAGSTPGLAWVIEQCRKLERPSKLIVIVPAGTANYEAFRGLCKGYGLQLPGYVMFAGMHGPVVGVIAFDEEWRPQATRFADIRVMDPMFLLDAETAMSIGVEL